MKESYDKCYVSGNTLVLTEKGKYVKQINFSKLLSEAGYKYSGLDWNTQTKQ